MGINLCRNNKDHIYLNMIFKYILPTIYLNSLDLFKQLYRTIKSDLTNDGNKFVCRNNKDHTISNVSDFPRKCQSIRDESDKFFVN